MLPYFSCPIQPLVKISFQYCLVLALYFFRYRVLDYRITLRYYVNTVNGAIIIRLKLYWKLLKGENINIPLKESK